MANVSDEYVKITLRNAGIRMNPLDKNNDPLPDILDKSMLSDLDKHLRAIKQTILSASNFTAYFNENMKKINEATGEMVQSFFVRKSDVPNVVSALRRKNAELAQGRTYLDFSHLDPQGQPTPTPISYLKGAQFEDVQMLNFKRRRAGKISQSLAEEALDNMGGKAYFASPKDKDKEMMSFALPVTESEINALGGMKEAKKHYGKVLTKMLKDSKSTEYSSAEMKGRNEAQKEEDEKRQQKLAEEVNRNKAHLIIRAIATLIAIASILRRILSVILSRATEDTKNAQESIRYSVNPINAIAYKRMERARGLDEGTTMSAIQAVQTKFGQTDKIGMDNQDLKTLAPVLTTKVANLVQTGLGKDRPEELMKMIINDFYNQANKGILWTGENVGKEDASRILIDRLSGFSPDMANILATMLYLNNRSTEYKGKIKDFDSLIDLGGEQSSYHLDTRIMEDLGIEVQEVTAKFKTLKENILDKLGASLAKFVDWASNTEMFMSTEDKAKRRLNAISSLNEASSKSKEQADKYENVAENYVKSRGIDVAKLGYSSVESWFNAEKFNLNPQDKRFIETALRLSTKWKEREKEATKEASLANPQYYKSEYNDYGVMNEVMQEMFHRQGVVQPVSTNEILSAYASSVYGKIGAEELLYGENNRDLINILAERFNIDGFWFKTKKANVQKAYKEGKIKDKDIQQVLLEKLRKAKRYGTWSKDYELGLDQEKVNFAYQQAQALAEAKLIETMFFENAIESAIAKKKSELGDNFMVKGASYDERNHTIKVVFDVNGKEINAFEADTWGNYKQTKGVYNINREYANAKK